MRTAVWILVGLVLVGVVIGLRVLQPPQAQAGRLLNEAKMAIRQGLTTQETAQQLEEALTLDPTNPEIMFYLGFAYRMNNRIIDAIPLFQTALESPTASTDQELRGLILLNLGTALAGIESYQQSFLSFAEMLQMSRPWPDRGIERAGTVLLSLYPRDEAWPSSSVRQFVIAMSLYSRQLYSVVLLSLQEHLDSPFNLLLYAISAQRLEDMERAVWALDASVDMSSDLVPAFLLFPGLHEGIEILSGFVGEEGPKRSWQNTSIIK